jgi:Dolichyl-phosphate-mannose-protein mannosyltransferase
MGTPNADEAVVGLMARHVLHGHLTAFAWGQPYGGTQEVLLTAPVFWVFGSGWLALRLVPIGLTVVAVLLLWRVGRRTVGEPAATIAAAVLWIWPPFAVFQLTHQQGYYASGFVYCALVLLCALRAAEVPDRRQVCELGFVLGLGFWQTAQIVPVAAGAVLWTIWRQPRALRHSPAAAVFGALGALPWIVWNSTHGWDSLTGIDASAYAHSLRLLASPALPMLVGLRVPLSAQLLLPSVLTYALYLGLIGLFLVGAWRARGQDRLLLYVVAAVFPFVYALSPKAALVLSTPRYVIVLAPVLTLLLVELAPTVWRGIGLLVLVGLVSVVTLHRLDDWFRGEPRPTTQERGLGPRDTVQLVPRDLDGLVVELDRLGLDHVYADYWLAYRLDFDTKERIIAVENRLLGVTFEGGQAVPTSPFDVRYVPYARAVRRSRYGFVFYRKLVGTASVANMLERHGYRRHESGLYVIYSPA